MHRWRNGTGDNRISVQPPFKIVGEFASRAITGMWIAFQAFRADCFQVAIQRWCQSAQFGSGLLSCLLNGFEREFACDWRLASQEIEQNRPQTIDVRYGRELSRRSVDLLGRNVPRGSENRGLVRETARWLEPLCQCGVAEQR